MANYGCVLLLVSMSCMMISAAPQFGIGIGAGLYDGYGGFGGFDGYGGYGQYGGHYGHGHHDYDHHDYYYPHHHHDYHHHHHDYHHHGHYKRDVGLQEYQRLPFEKVTFDEDFFNSPYKQPIIADPKHAPVDQH